MRLTTAELYFHAFQKALKYSPMHMREAVETREKNKHWRGGRGLYLQEKPYH
jgi:hypothetical protein